MANAFEQPNQNQSADKFKRPKDVDDMTVFQEFVEKSAEAREISRTKEGERIIIRKLGNAGEIYELVLDGNNVIEMKEEDERGNIVNFFGHGNKHPDNDYSQMEMSKERAVKKAARHLPN